MAQVKNGPWSYGCPALVHDPIRQRVQFHQKAQRKGQYRGQGLAGHNACSQQMASNVCYPLIRGEGKPARSSPSLDRVEGKAAAQPALPTAGMAQPALNPESLMQPPQRMRTALDLTGEGFLSLRHERKKLKASSCANAAGENEERNIS